MDVVRKLTICPLYYGIRILWYTHTMVYAYYGIRILWYTHTMVYAYSKCPTSNVNNGMLSHTFLKRDTIYTSMLSVCHVNH